jgi:hypothetical protein
MQLYEYKVVPAPSRGEKARGARSGEERLAVAVANAINALAREGWEYLRCDMLPSEERSGLTRRTTVYHNLLIFRRPRPEASAPPARVEEPPLVNFRHGSEPEGPAPRLGPADRDLAAE